MTVSFVVVIFSYNRGVHLVKCIDSLRRCSPQSRIVVVDDSSDDPGTLLAMDSFGDSITLLRSRSDQTGWHGGLYHNMNLALQSIGSFDLVMFVQDDMQFVRPFGVKDFERFAELIDDAGGEVFLYPAFLKANTVSELNLQPDSKADFYISENPEIVTGRYYSDIFIASPRALRDADWQFCDGESWTAQAARNVFHPMRYLRDPVVAYVPRPKSYRRKRQNILVSSLEAIMGFGRFEFAVMSDQEDKEFVLRPSNDLPIAEKYLSILGGSLSPPWEYSVFEMNRIVFPLYYFVENPLAYTKHQLRKQLSRLRSAFRKA